MPRSSPMRSNSSIALAAALLVALASSSPAPGTDDLFAIRIVDDATGRGVPLVELRTTNKFVFVTDSGGWAAIDQPELYGRTVFFHVSSHGYEFPADGFGFRGARLDVERGGRETLELRRLNIAERLYRVTGAGIYADSVQLGEPVPIDQPLLNAQVAGQDSVQAVTFRDRIYWFWGDTNRLRYPLGHFGTAGAVSDLPGRGGLDPETGIDLRYFTGEEGFSRPMFDLGRPGMVWTDAVVTLRDESGAERLIAHYSRMKSLGERLEHGLAVFDIEVNMFTPVMQFPDDAPLSPAGHAFRVRDDSGIEFIYFATPYPLVRVQAEWEAVLDPSRYEAFTPLQPGARFDPDAPPLDRDAEGRVHYGWKPNTQPVKPAQEARLIDRGVIRAEESHLHTVDAETGAPVLLHGGTVRWSAHRQRWIMIAVEQFGEPSFLGEVWCAEAETPEGPWPRAVKIVTHDDYSFYNPCHHAFLDDDRHIHFEGTYTKTFSGAETPTPRYDYNQIMYRLDLDDPRLDAAR